MDDSLAVYVAVCGRVERVDVAELTLDGLCAAVSARFDIGDRLRFISDEEGEPEVSTDDHLKRLAKQRQTLRVLIGDTALSDLEQRMWQLRQLQWGFFQDELARVKNHQQGLRNEMRQLRTALEQSARREVELTGELMNERRLREKSDQNSVERHEAICAELRREQRARDTTEAALRKDLEDARQAALKFAANAERQNSELKGAIMEESRNRGKNIEALLAEWAGSQAEIRQAIEGVRSDLDRGVQDAERQAKGLLREASAREAFEQFFGEKIRVIELSMGKVEGQNADLDRRIGSAMQEAQDSSRAGYQELRMIYSDLREDIDHQKAKASEVTLAVTSPVNPIISTQMLQPTMLSSSTATLPRHPSPGPLTRSPSALGAIHRSTTPPPALGAAGAPVLSSVTLSPAATSIVRRAPGPPTAVLRSGSFGWAGAS
jgi:hypothetical protein